MAAVQTASYIVAQYWSQAPPMMAASDTAPSMPLWLRWLSGSLSSWVWNLSARAPCVKSITLISHPVSRSRVLCGSALPAITASTAISSWAIHV
eukprot:1079210-Rhodomonas_salina.1